MTNEKSKYDTDPLDPEFVRRTGEISGATREVGRTPAEEIRRREGADAPTRLFFDEREPLDAPYPSIFTSPGASQPLGEQSAHGGGRASAQDADASHSRYAPPRDSFADQQSARREPPPSARVIPGVGLPENILMVAPYAPLFIGAVAAIIELLLVPRDERRTRFHAAQGLALHGAVLAGALLLRIARLLATVTFGSLASGLLWFVWLLFFIATIVFFVNAIMRVWRGETFRVEAVGEVTRWLDEQIAPRPPNPAR